jgi:signal transduction histidine kinase
MRRIGRDTAYLLLGVPVSAVAFGLFLTTAILGGLLAVTFIGLPIWLALAYAGRLLSDVERRRAVLVLGERIPSSYRPWPKRGLGARAKVIVRDPATWRDLAWQLVVSVVGFVGGVIAATLWISVGYGLTFPLYWWALPHSALPELSDSWTVDNWARVSLLFGLGLLLGFVTVPIVRALAVGQARFARAILSPSRRAALEERVDELATTRRAAADTQTEELQRIERDLHDGAQARLVALAIDVGLAREKLDSDPEAARSLMESATDDAKAALAELRELVRGVHPAVLADRGLDGALSALAARSPVPVTLELEPADRPTPAVEAAAYFVVAEGLANVAKHSGAAQSVVRVARQDGRLVVEVVDDGVGGADATRGTGIAGLEHRVRALDGVLRVESPRGGPTTLRVEVPCAS